MVTGTEWSIRRRERLDGLADLLIYASGSSVLDLGCHRGLVGYELAKRGARLVHGCDMNRDAVVMARNLFEDTDVEHRFEVRDLIAPDALNWCNPEGYDIILLLGVLHKLRRQMDGQRIAEFIRTLGRMSNRFIAFNGAEEDKEPMESSLSGMICVHHSRLTDHPTAVTAVWRRQ